MEIAHAREGRSNPQTIHLFNFTGLTNFIDLCVCISFQFFTK